MNDSNSGVDGTPPPPAADTHALETWLAEHEEDLVELAMDLVGIDSQNPPGETRAVVGFIEEYVRELGLETERIVAVDAKPNLLVTLPGTSETTLLYNGHVDTVPYDRDDWTYEPLGERASGRLYGRGMTDMKGAVAAMVHAVRAYVETGTSPPVTLAFAFVSDEETAGPAGLPALLERGRLDADACIIGETTCEAGLHSVTVADKGSIWVTLEADGVAAHGSRPPLGENAIDNLFDAIGDVRAWGRQFEFDVDDEIAPIVEESVAFYASRMDEATARQLFTRPTINLGTVTGGGTINQVPDTAMAELDVRLTAGVETPSVVGQIEAILSDHPNVEIADMSWSRGTYEPFDSPLAAAISHEAETVAGEPVYRRSATGGGDAKNLRNEGISAVEFAFGTDTAHAVDEYLPVRALQNNAVVFTRLPYSFASRLDETAQ